MELLRIFHIQDRALADQDETTLSILMNSGMLHLYGPLINSVYGYSPAEMVENYIKTYGAPKEIVLGCGHASSLPFLKALGLKQEVWCDGACKNRPHAGALVVSLDEPSADVLSDFNHPEFWLSLAPDAVEEIHDESWCFTGITNETFRQIVRVLKVSGIFTAIINPENKNKAIRNLRKFGLVPDVNQSEPSLLKMVKTR